MGVASALLLRQSILGGNRSSSSRIFGKAERRETSSLLTADSKQHLRMHGLCQWAEAAMIGFVRSSAYHPRPSSSSVVSLDALALRNASLDADAPRRLPLDADEWKRRKLMQSVRLGERAARGVQMVLSRAKRLRPGQDAISND